jgi:streptomycin 6-kinase
MMIIVPETFARIVSGHSGAAGRVWLASLPVRVDWLCEEWRLTPDGPVIHGGMSLVLPVMHSGLPCVLRLSWLMDSHDQEVAALRAWDGHGAVRLFDSSQEHAATLLERLDASRTLELLPLRPALDVAGTLLRRLAVPAPMGLTTLADWADDFAGNLHRRWTEQKRPFSAEILDRVGQIATELGPASASRIVHRDLWYGNILAGRREPWLAIDPMIVAGDPEFGVAQLLWTRAEEIETSGGSLSAIRRLCEVSGLDVERSHAWTLVRCADYWLWGLSVGLTIDPERCCSIVEQLSS